MNAMDTAEGWVRLYELKSGKGYEAASHPLTEKQTPGGKQMVGVFYTIADEVGVDKHSVWDHLRYLTQPEYIQEALRKGDVSRTYIMLLTYSVYCDMFSVLRRISYMGHYWTGNQEEEELVYRAIKAFFRFGGPGTPMPSKDSGIALNGEKRYVVLVNSSGVLAIYRERNDGKLKRLKRWPKKIEEGFL